MSLLLQYHMSENEHKFPCALFVSCLHSWDLDAQESGKQTCDKSGNSYGFSGVPSNYISCLKTADNPRY